MSFDFLGEHQLHVLLRIFLTAALFLGTVGVLFWLTRRYAAKQKLLKEKGPARSEAKVEILTRDGWRVPKKKRKRHV